MRRIIRWIPTAWNRASAGLAVDQTNTLSYFLGTRYVNSLNTNQVTVAMDYQLTQKYRLIATESFDTLIS